MHKGIAVVVLLATWSINTCQAQKPPVPDEYNWTTAESYSKDSLQVLECLRVLTDPASHADLEWWSSANAYTMAWLSGTPHFRLDIRSEVLPFLDDHEELLYPFIHGMAYFSLTHPAVKDPVQLMAEGLRTVAVRASTDKTLKKNGGIKPLLRAFRRHKLDQYINQRLGAKQE